MLMALAAGDFFCPQTQAQRVQSQAQESKAQSRAEGLANKATTVAPKAYKLKVVQESGWIFLSLKGTKARLADIASDLSKRLHIEVVLGSAMKKRLVTTDFEDVPLESAVQILAPHVYVDYELSAGAPAKPLGIFLYGREEDEPSANAIVKSNSQALFFEGDTEEGVESSEYEKNKENRPLQVYLENHYLTLKAKKQPLAVVLVKIAGEMGVPAELKYDSDEIVDINIIKAPLEEAIVSLSPNVRLYLRADLLTLERTPLLLQLVPPADIKTSSSAYPRGLFLSETQIELCPRSSSLAQASKLRSCSLRRSLFLRKDLGAERRQRTCADGAGPTVAAGPANQVGLATL